MAAQPTPPEITAAWDRRSRGEDAEVETVA